VTKETDMKTKILMLTAAALLSPACIAHAQDGAFSGPNLSAGVSYTDLSVDQRVYAGTGRIDQSNRAAAYRVAGGYDVQFDNFVVGGEVGARFGGPSVSARVGAVNVSEKAGLSWDYSARAGFVLADSALIYGRVGGARTSLRQTSTPVGSTTAQRRTETSDGLMYGAGIEFAVAEGWGARAEYTRTNAEDDTHRDDFTVSVVTRF